VRILITGGFGFVGGRLAQRLATRGARIVLGSRCRREPPPWLPVAETLQTNWSDASSLKHICDGVDVLVHAAGMNANDCEADPVAALAVNGLSTSRLVAAAGRAGVRRFFYLSTAHVYASPLTGTITEDSCPRNLHPYATSHIAGEQAVQYALRDGKMEGAVLRLSNAFGVPTHGDVDCWMLVVNDLCRQAVENNRLTLRSSGLQLRDFVAMEVVCETIQQLIQNTAIDTFGPVINVGSGRSLSILAMAELIRERCGHILGSKPALHTLQPSAAETVAALNFCVAKLTKLGVQCDTSFVEEIDRLLIFCRETFVNRLTDIG
jgi:UDP-glucose 4-epimerase